ncbi:MAG: iron ABC transporter permease [Spirochaetes bacterium]|uniref:Iron ABC transporter permease n=1 Tax=Candidatus Ornithospirochaeta stercoravium TaxID=2840897 RepID=A0A9D9ID54_9SPIO|nr:iron ABC transporter permease [Candidatus Ornithospirochaeta stercoravium]
MNKKAFRIAFPLLITLTILIALLSLLIGSADINPVHAILNKDSTDHIILFSVRLPRMLAAMLAGLALSVSGLLLQSATGNDLASPNIIGMNSGSGFAVLLFLSFFSELFDVLPFAAFIGGLVASSLVFIISASVSRMNSSGSLILGGIAVNALFNAFISTLSSLDPDVLSTYSAFSIGGFSSVQASMLYVPGIIIIASSVAAFFMTERMDVIRLGDEIASSMGYRPLSIRVSLVAIAALASSSAVTFAGLLGFVGLVTPHIARFISEGESRKTLLLTVVIGPLLVMLSDLLARTVVMPGELPAGVFMAIIGVPFFLFLLIRRAR